MPFLRKMLSVVRYFPPSKLRELYLYVRADAGVHRTCCRLYDAALCAKQQEFCNNKNKKQVLLLNILPVAKR